MSYTVEKMAGEPVVLIRLNADYDAATEMAGTLHESTALIAQQNEPVFSIWDIERTSVNLESLMAGTNAARLDSAAPPNQAGSIILGNSPYLKLLAKGLDSSTYGNLKIAIFEQMDDALAYIHGQLNKA